MLNRRQQAFAENYVLCGNAAEAARLAGYAANSARITGSRLLTNVYVMDAVHTFQREIEARLAMSRKRVLNELEHAVEQAKLQGDVNSTIAAWREIAKICGYYSPEKQIRILPSISAGRAIQDLEAMPTEELLQLANQDQ